MNSTIQQISWASVFGLVGFALIAIWPLAKSRRALLAGQGASAAAFAAHYLLIGAITGAAATSLSLVQAATAWPAGARPWWCRTLYAATVPALAALTWATWAGWPSACAALGLALATVARWHTHPAVMRAFFFAAVLAWVVHDILTSSTPGLLADTACGATLIYGWLRDASASRAAA